MKKANRLRKDRDFRRVYRRGRSLSNRYLVLIYKKNGLEDTRIGFSISKKFGKAVERNRIKRQLRSICREYLPDLKRGYDMVFVVRAESKQADYNELKSAVYELLKKARLYSREIDED